jgi:predicted acylesterase/phospholipase RssA
MVKRAITLGGGGPAAGLHIGVLEALAEDKIDFKVWALSCIGAWVGIVYHVYNPSDKNKVINQNRAELTYQFFRDGVFRDDESYKHFPINRAFAPDWGSNIWALGEFVTDLDNYSDFRWQPDKIIEYVRSLLKNKPSVEWSEGDLYRWILNEVMAPNPFIRYLTSMMYLSKVNGLSRINYPNSEFMKSIQFEKLKDLAIHVFHNAWNLDNQQLALFSNHPFKEKKEKYEYVDFIDSRTLCACSALPYIEETVEIDTTQGGSGGNKFTYCEGALVDTVNFQSLLEEHGDLEEIWISRIVDSHQIRKPENLVDGLSNLCQLFAATVGEDDVKLFKYHVVERKWEGKVVEIHVPGHINFKWNHKNLANSRKLGYAAAKQAIAAYNEGRGERVNGVFL